MATFENCEIFSNFLFLILTGLWSHVEGRQLILECGHTVKRYYSRFCVITMSKERKLFLQIWSLFPIARFKPLMHGQINLIKLILHIFWIKNCSTKSDVYSIKLIWNKLIKLVLKKWTHFDLQVTSNPAPLFLLSDDFLSSLE